MFYLSNYNCPYCKEALFEDGNGYKFACPGYCFEGTRSKKQIRKLHANAKLHKAFDNFDKALKDLENTIPQLEQMNEDRQAVLDRISGK